MNDNTFFSLLIFKNPFYIIFYISYKKTIKMPVFPGLSPLAEYQGFSVTPSVASLLHPIRQQDF
jgi:5,10-methylenetetrahydrofolate reductase